MAKSARAGRWDPDDWETEVAAPFRTFLQSNIRTRAVALTMPFNWAVKRPRLFAMEKQLEGFLGRWQPESLPPRPQFAFLTTDLITGRLVSLPHDAGVSKWPISRVVMASASFPPFFGPSICRATDGRKCALVDGGVWGNLGVSGRILESGAFVLVSDASYPLVPITRFDRLPRLWAKRALRVAVQRGDSALRHQMWLADSERQRFEVWRINDSSNRSDGADGSYEYHQELALNIARIRTDLDKLTADEIGILENHGYLRASSSMSWLITRLRAGLDAAQRPTADATSRFARLALRQEFPMIVPPHPELLAPSAVDRALRGSSHRILRLRRFRRAP